MNTFFYESIELMKARKRLEEWQTKWASSAVELQDISKSLLEIEARLAKADRLLGYPIKCDWRKHAS